MRGSHRIFILLQSKPLPTTKPIAQYLSTRPDTAYKSIHAAFCFGLLLRLGVVLRFGFTLSVFGSALDVAFRKVTPRKLTLAYSAYAIVAVSAPESDAIQ